MRAPSVLCSVFALLALGGAARPARAQLAIDPAVDLHNVYAWMNAAGTKVNLAMTLSPFDQGAQFGSDVLYVFHVAVHERFGAPPRSATRVICKFNNIADVECWIGRLYVRGNPLRGFDTGEVAVFAARRADPFFHYVDGFERGVGRLALRRSTPVDASGCRMLGASDAAYVLGAISLAPVPACDRYLHENVLALVVQARENLFGVTSTATILSVWASTHARR